MAIINGNKGMVYGVCEPKPLKGFPEGKARIRMRNTDFVMVYVRTFDGIRQFVVRDDGENWIPGYEQGANYQGIRK